MNRALWALLLASLVANVYLWLARPQAGHPAPPRHDAANTRSPSPRVDLAKLARTVTAPAPPPAQLDRTTLEQRLIRVEASIEEHRPLDDRFDRAVRAPRSEARARAILDRVFAPARGPAGSASSPYSIECHGDVCTLESTVDSFEWTMAIQEPPLRMMFGEMEFTSEHVLFSLTPPDKLGEALVRGIYIAVQRSTQGQLCIAGSPNAKGTLSIAVQFDQMARRFSATVGGTLADQPVAACLRTALDSICASTPVPAELTTVPPVDPLVLELPMEAPN